MSEIFGVSEEISGIYRVCEETPELCIATSVDSGERNHALTISVHLNTAETVCGKCSVEDLWGNVE
jgi:hypothetical protein